MPALARNTPSQWQLAYRLLTPSLCSSTVVILLAALALAIPAWSFLEDSQPLFAFFYGPQGVVTVLERPAAGAAALWNSLISLPATYNIIIVIFALGIGGLVFITLQIANRVTGNINSSMAVIRFAPPQFKKSVEKEVERRFMTRAGLSLMWLLYCFITVTLLWPFCILAIRTSIGQFPDAQSWQYLALGSGLFILVLHLHVVVLRAIALRPRLFGVTDVIYR